MADELTYFRPRDGLDAEPEKILSCGHQGAGKSTDWMEIARRMHETGAPGHLYVMDTTREVKRMLQETEEFRGLLRSETKQDKRGNVVSKIINPDGNVDLTMATGWDQMVDWTDNVAMEQADVGDWVVVEMVGSVWRAVTNAFTVQIYEQTMGEFLMSAREDIKRTGKKGLDGLSRNTDWNPINFGYYEKFARKLFTLIEAHLFMTTGTKLLGDSEKEDVKKMFGGWGRKPDGQNQLGFQCHTLIEKARNKDGEFEAHTIKDRGSRTWLVEEPITNFALDYLVACAHWKWGKEARTERRLTAVGAEE